ncbi:hypothetical protein T484DRAFT_1852323 [Baffinella frigidus]|nr:hypothetical protein T484DRAFT_1852323 [Cryptophyta sp. CCMP2293]
MSGVYSFWGSKVQPDGTPSEICLPATLNITTACLDPDVEVKPGSRVTVWAAKKERGPKGALEVQRSLICTLQAGRVETAQCKVVFEKATLLSLSCQEVFEKATLLSLSVALSINRLGAGVFLSGFFDSREEEEEEENLDDGTISWGELQRLLKAADNRAGSNASENGEDEESDDHEAQMASFKRQVKNAQLMDQLMAEGDDEEEEDDEDFVPDEEEEEEGVGQGKKLVSDEEEEEEGAGHGKKLVSD